MGCWRQQRLHLTLGQIPNSQKNVNRFIMDHWNFNRLHQYDWAKP